ncbi:MAG: 50S ribosomal protein L24 [Desulfatirhabdiaceae bacterium]
MTKNTCHLKKDDKVKVITGKDKGKIGKILKINSKKSSILVEHANIIKKHTKKDAKNRQGGIVETEAPINWSNVMMMCNRCMSPVRIKMALLDGGKKVRVCRKCNEQIDK